MPLTVFLRPGREKKLLNFHCLVYREEIGRMEGRESAGGVVDVRSADGLYLGRGTYSRFAHIPLRLLTRVDEPIDRAFFERRLGALLARKRSLVPDSNSFRWVHGEADGLPGLVIDVFGEVVVVQVRTLGMERLREQWEPLLLELTGARGLQERSDMKRRQEERLERVNRTVCGVVPKRVEITEGPATYLADVRHGLKTGFFLDQRENRALIRRHCQPGMRVLDLFTYTGGFAINAGLAGATGLAVDLKPDALELCRENLAANKVEGFEAVERNCFNLLDDAVARGERWDLIVVDPPAISHSAEQWERLRWAIWRLANRSLQLLGVGGKMFVFTCSQHLNRERLLEALRFAGADAGRHLQIRAEATQPPDHPWSLQMPESLYLKGFLTEVTEVTTARPIALRPGFTQAQGTPDVPDDVLDPADQDE